MAMRRSVVKGILVTIGGFVGSAFMGLGERAHALTAGGGLGNQWFEDELADTREANSVEASQILPDIRKRVVDIGYPQDVVETAAFGVTSSVSPRGTTVLKAGLRLNEELFFTEIKELLEAGDDRAAFMAYRTDGQTYLQRLSERQTTPEGFAELQQENPDGFLPVASSECCGAFGTPPATCCRYELKAMFECCTPCIFGGIPLGVMCVMIWCNYCAVSHCKEYYHVC